MSFSRLWLFRLRFSDHMGRDPSTPSSAEGARTERLWVPREEDESGAAPLPPLPPLPPAAPGQVIVAPGGGLKAAVDQAYPGTELLLEDGVQDVGSGTVSIGKNLTLRAANMGQAVLDGGDSVGVLSIAFGFVVLVGLNITRGYAGIKVSWICHFQETSFRDC